MAAGMAIVVEIKAANAPSMMELLKARIMDSFCESSTYHFKVKPRMGNEANCWVSKERIITTTMGRNMNT
jgi:L-arabinose isomerase